MVQEQSLGEDRELGAAEFELAVMAEDHVLDQAAELGREAGGEVIGDDAQADLHVAEQAAFGGVGEAAGVFEFGDLADVVEDDAGEEQVGVDAGVVARP